MPGSEADACSFRVKMQAASCGRRRQKQLRSNDLSRRPQVPIGANLILISSGRRESDVGRALGVMGSQKAQHDVNRQVTHEFNHMCHRFPGKTRPGSFILIQRVHNGGRFMAAFALDTSTPDGKIRILRCAGDKALQEGAGGRYRWGGGRAKWRLDRQGRWTVDGALRSLAARAVHLCQQSYYSGTPRRRSMRRETYV